MMNSIVCHNHEDLTAHRRELQRQALHRKCEQERRNRVMESIRLMVKKSEDKIDTEQEKISA